MFYFFLNLSNLRVQEDSSGNITMKETGSKPLKREDLDSDVSLVPMLLCLNNGLFWIDQSIAWQ